MTTTSDTPTETGAPSRSLTSDTLLSGVAANAKPAIEDGVAGTPDSFRHRVVTTTVFLRN